MRAQVIGEGKVQVSGSGQQEARLTDPKTGANAGVVYFTVGSKQGGLGGAMQGAKHGGGVGGAVAGAALPHPRPASRFLLHESRLGLPQELRMYPCLADRHIPPLSTPRYVSIPFAIDRGTSGLSCALESKDHVMHKTAFVHNGEPTACYDDSLR